MTVPGTVGNPLYVKDDVTSGPLLVEGTVDVATLPTVTATANSLPLPTGAATSAKQDTEAGKLDTLHTDLGLLATDAHLAAFLAANHTDLAALHTDLAALSTTELTLFASASRTGTQNGTDQTNDKGRTIIIAVDLTVKGSTSLTVTLQGKDPVSGKYFGMYTSGAINATATWTFAIGPGIATAGSTNGVVSLPLPRTWRVVITPSDGNANTYSVGAMVGP